MVAAKDEASRSDNLAAEEEAGRPAMVAAVAEASRPADDGGRNGGRDWDMAVAKDKAGQLDNLAAEDKAGQPDVIAAEAEAGRPARDPRLQGVESRGTEESGKERRKKRTKAHPVCLCPGHEQGEIKGGVRIVGKRSRELIGAKDGRHRCKRQQLPPRREGRRMS